MFSSLKSTSENSALLRKTRKIEHGEKTPIEFEPAFEVSTTMVKSEFKELRMEEEGDDIRDHVSCCKEIETQLQNSLEIIEGKSEIVRVLKRLRLDQVIGRYEAWLVECRDEISVHEYLCRILSGTFQMSDEDVRKAELGDAILYYLMKDKEPEIVILRIIYSSYDLKCSWPELCCAILGKGVQSDKKSFIQLYKRLSTNITALQYLLYKRPQLLLNEHSYKLVERLIEYLPYDSLHQILKKVQDENKQTHMFHIYRFHYKPYVLLYQQHAADLYELLSIRDKNGQTALHVKTTEITELLSNLFTHRYKTRLLGFYSMKDKNDQSALDVADDHGRQVLSSLIRRVQNNEYTTRSASTRVIIIYISKNRLGAEEEAQMIFSDLQSKYANDKITIAREQTREEIIQQISQAARESSIDTSLIVILMSHGNVGTINDSEGNKIKLSKIEEAMCSENISGRPKILITQCCQIGEESAPTPAYVPIHDDFCAIMSCVAGEKSTRGAFLSKLAENIRESKRNENIFKLVGRVCKGMQEEKHEQTPIIMSTLKAQLVPIKQRTGVP